MRNVQCAMCNVQLNYKSPVESTRLEGVSFVEYSRVCRRRARIGMNAPLKKLIRNAECGIEFAKPQVRV